MLNRWPTPTPVQWSTPSAACAGAANLLGTDPDLVLAGGGNVSAKGSWTEFDGRTVPALFVTPSGTNLATVKEDHIVPLALERLHRLLALPTVEDLQMQAELELACLTHDRRRPSVETLLHAVIPARFVLHSHADAILALANTGEAEKHIRDALGDSVAIVGYHPPGFMLARHVADTWAVPDQGGAGALVLGHHGLVTYAETAQEAYNLHIDTVGRAEAYLEHRAFREAPPRIAPPPAPQPADVAELRRRLSTSAGRPMITVRTDGPELRQGLTRPEILRALQRGPITPDHVIHTKHTPLLGTDVEEFSRQYLCYVDRHRHQKRGSLTLVDPAPRVVVDNSLGLITAGVTAAEARTVRDIFVHTLRVVTASEGLGGYRGIHEADLFNMEYWDLEQAKFEPARAARRLMDGRVALVTGAASGIGKACAQHLLAAGAAVVGLDIDEAVTSLAHSDAFAGLVCDVTSPSGMDAAAALAAEQFGGIDILVASAGLFGRSQPITDIDLDSWHRTMSVNLDGVLLALQAVHPLLARAPGGGSVVLIASKNVPAPGPGASAYSASKAAAAQLARVAALEWAKDGIRVNMVHPDAVFDTGLWTPELLAERAAKYGLSIDEYKRRNLLSTEVTSTTVAELVVQLCSSPFACTTGAQISIDGGSDRVI